MDLQERLADYIESLNTGIQLYNDFNSEESSISIYPIAGGRTIVEYMDGEREKELNFEIQGKVKIEEREKITIALSKIGRGLEELEELNSSNESFEFHSCKVSSDTYLSDVTEDNYIYFRIAFIVDVTIKKK